MRDLALIKFVVHLVTLLRVEGLLAARAELGKESLCALLVRHEFVHLLVLLLLAEAHGLIHYLFLEFLVLDAFVLILELQTLLDLLSQVHALAQHFLV